MGGRGGTAGSPSAGADSGGSSNEEGGDGPVSPAAGEGGTSPGQGGSGTSGTHVGGPIPNDEGPQQQAGKVDLLLAVDNSPSMAGKQKLLADALTELVERLVNPRCVDTEGNVVSVPASPDAGCPGSSQREMKPVRDLHIGAITSSLGSHGNDDSISVCGSEQENDHAYLLPLIREGVSSYDSLGYLKWDPDGLSPPPGEGDRRPSPTRCGSWWRAPASKGADTKRSSSPFIAS